MADILTIGDVEYDITSMTEEQKAAINIRRIYQNTVASLLYQLRCVKRVGELEAEELKQSLATKPVVEAAESGNELDG